MTVIKGIRENGHRVKDCSVTGCWTKEKMWWARKGSSRVWRNKTKIREDSKEQFVPFKTTPKNTTGHGILHLEIGQREKRSSMCVCVVCVCSGAIEGVSRGGMCRGSPQNNRRWGHPSLSQVQMSCKAKCWGRFCTFAWVVPLTSRSLGQGGERCTHGKKVRDYSGLNSPFLRWLGSGCPTPPPFILGLSQSTWGMQAVAPTPCLVRTCCFMGKNARISNPFKCWKGRALLLGHWGVGVWNQNVEQLKIVPMNPQRVGGGESFSALSTWN